MQEGKSLKQSLVVSSKHGRNIDYWRDKTDEERWQGIEALRQMIYGYDPATARIERVFEVAPHPRG